MASTFRSTGTLMRASALLLLMCGAFTRCAPSDAARTSQPGDSSTAQRSAAPPPPPPASDSVATLALLTQLAQRIDRDTAAMDKRQADFDVGAGVRGTVTGWRIGPVWRRVHVASRSEQFSADDTYWLSSGQLVGARLSVARPRRKAEIDSVWFREQRLYRWTDAERRHLNVTSRSTQYQVQMLRSTLDQVIAALAAADRVPAKSSVQRAIQ